MPSSKGLTAAHPESQLSFGIEIGAEPLWTAGFSKCDIATRAGARSAPD
jgi:hypothetical protein